MNSTFGRMNAWTEMDRAGQQEIPAGDGRRLELWAYLDAYTFRSGEEVAVKVHTTAASFDLEVVCDSGPGETMHAVKGIAGRRQHTPCDAYAAGCAWEDSHTFRIAPRWPAGVYLILLRAERGGESMESEAFFVVAPP